MPNSSSRKRLTVVASVQGVKIAEKALIRLGFESKTSFAKAQLLARTAVTKFFNRQPAQIDTFKRICAGLKLDWQEILEPESRVETVELTEIGQSEVVAMSTTATTQRLETLPNITRQLTVVGPQQEIKAVIVLEGDIASVDANFKATLEVLLECKGGNTIQITDIQAGSIRITIQGSQQDIERLRQQITSGELNQVNDLPIEAIAVLGEEPLQKAEDKSIQNKWDIARKITTQQRIPRKLISTFIRNVNSIGANLINFLLRDFNFIGANLIEASLRGFNLIGAFLNNTNLNDADLSDTDLSRSDLSSANLHRANLSGADLSSADLSNANLSGADLSNADLCGANLSNTNLSGALVQNARFGQGLGLTDEEKQDLVRRGAIFEDTSSDRKATYLPTNR